MDIYKPKLLVVDAGVRYWEDTTVNGVEDEQGTLIPFRKGDRWNPVIELETGLVKDWPEGMQADVHYKVCDDGQYWLGDDFGNQLKWQGDYVPDDFLCVGDRGYGDYIILKIDKTGHIVGWKKPTTIDLKEWN